GSKCTCRARETVTESACGCAFAAEGCRKTQVDQSVGLSQILRASVIRPLPMTHSFPAAGPVARALKHLASERENIMKISLVAGPAVVAAVALPACGAMAQGRDTIHIAGSSAVLPFASLVAAELGSAFPEHKTPVVGSRGTGGGL